MGPYESKWSSDEEDSASSEDLINEYFSVFFLRSWSCFASSVSCRFSEQNVFWAHFRRVVITVLSLSLFLTDVRSSLVDFVDCFSSIASWPREGANFFFGRNTSLNLQVSGLPRFSNFIILATALAIGRTSKSCFVVLGFGTVTKRRGPPINHLTLSNVVVMLMI